MRRRPGTGGGGSPSDGQDRNRPPERAQEGAGRQAGAPPPPAPGRPGCPACCEERCSQADSSSRVRSFGRGNAAAVPDPAGDMGAAPLGRPSLALEHLEHGDLFRRQGIALDRLQMSDLRQPAVCGWAPGFLPTITQGFSSRRGRADSTLSAAPESGTIRAPVLESRRRNSAGSRSMSSHLPNRHPADCLNSPRSSAGAYGVWPCRSFFLLKYRQNTGLRRVRAMQRLAGRSRRTMRGASYNRTGHPSYTGTVWMNESRIARRPGRDPGQPAPEMCRPAMYWMLRSARIRKDNGHRRTVLRLGQGTEAPQTVTLASAGLCPVGRHEQRIPQKALRDYTPLDFRCTSESRHSVKCIGSRKRH